MTDSRKPEEKFKNAVIQLVEPRERCSTNACSESAPFKISVLKTTQGKGSAYMIRYLCLTHKNAFIERTTGEVVQ